MRQERDQFMVKKGLDPQTGLLDNRNVERVGALQERNLGFVRNEGERSAQINEQKAQQAAESSIVGLSGKNKRGLERDVSEANIRKKQIDEQVKIESTRFGVPGFDDRETQGRIDALKTERARIDKELGMKREDGLRGLKGAKAEVQAQKLENSGHEELAARKRDEVQLEERILELREKGLSAEEATKQARSEEHQARLNRRNQANAGGSGDQVVGQDFIDAGWRVRDENTRKVDEQMRAIQVDSMTGIGGNSGAGGNGGAMSIWQAMLRELQRANGPQSPTLRQPKWDDENRPGPRGRSPY
jgi:hypothetical protein